MSKNDYQMTIGIECHVQLKTKTKLFSGASNDDRDTKPNTVVNHIDFGLPGALPVLNEKAVELATRAAFALSTRPQKFSKFDRKHYFYPDLPMGYQISQYDYPVIAGGHVEFEVDGRPHTVNITRAHLEADAGKSVHPEKGNFSLIDLNRAGTPLLEIVSEPEMHSSKEARNYAKQLQLLMLYAGVSEANLFYGNMRFDVNVSVSKTKELGTRAEIKNLNSFRAVERAIDYEFNRQVELLENGEKIVQETRGYSDSTGKTYSLRTKENADDYRYMPDPDLPPVILADDYIERIAGNMPKLPNEWFAELKGKSVPSDMASILIENEAQSESRNLEGLVKLDNAQAKTFAAWVCNIEIPLRDTTEVKLSDSSRYEMYGQVQALIKNTKLSSTNAKALIIHCLTNNVSKDLEGVAKSLNLIQESNEDLLIEIVDKVITANPKAAEDIKNGETKAIGFLVGQVMKESRGQANPGIVNALIAKRLDLK